MAEPMTYVYGIMPDPGTDATPDVLGVGGAAVRVVREAGLAALVSTVDAAEFGEEPLRTNLEDLQWLEATARAHNQVLLVAAPGAAVAPFGLATVYFDDDRVRALLAERSPDFTEVLRTIEGRVEWGVKAYADLDNPALRRAGTSAVEEPAGGPGASYLRQLRERRDSRADAEGVAVELAGEVHDELSALAAASRVHPPQNRELAGYAGLMVLNCSYLVDEAAGEEFAAQVRALAGRNEALEVQLTGPWPPYSFAEIRTGGEQ
ncbi:GvpL/GvpF family gas vesicle protein [Saccharopolyspora sp. NPDC000359]|uniref:GvpL/GvpF family gas vesicle protein n=1 Tax=Saccharopolyspora sp. NPDC000359 TaxID=3154251 RepID=UPI0033187E9D